MEKMAAHLRAKKNLEKHENFCIMETTKKLKELLDIGAITQEEYQSKKAELMSSVRSYEEKNDSYLPAVQSQE